MWNLAKIAQVAANVVSTPQAVTPKLGLGKTVFMDNGQEVTAIRQNPNTGTEWAQLAQQGHDVVQFKAADGTWVAVSVDGKPALYSDKPSAADFVQQTGAAASQAPAAPAQATAPRPRMTRSANTQSRSSRT